MPNISGLTQETTKATSLSNLILVSPQTVVGYQPQSKPAKNGEAQQQPPSILFHYEGEQSVMLESDITDHFIEDNTTIQDQIALRPEMITTAGYIGELTDIPPRPLQFLKDALSKLTIIDAFVPGTSVTALRTYNQAFQAYQAGLNAVNSAVAAWSSVTGRLAGADLTQTVIGSRGIAAEGRSQNKQQAAFQQFYGYWQTRTLFTVQTPWAVFQNMAIKSLRAIQSPDTRMITDFEVTFKMMRFAKTDTRSADTSKKFDGRAQSQAAPVVDLGTTTPPVSESLSSRLPGLTFRGQ